jgi:hypothetical protein
LTEIGFRGKTSVEADKEMHNPTTDIEQMIQELNAIQLPGSLMESFDAYREDALRSATKEFTPSQLNWYLDLLNRFRGPDDRRDSLLDVFDPEMYTASHPAWDAPPGTRIQMPALTSEVAKLADRNSEFADLAREEIREFCELAESFADEEVLGLTRIAQAALVDQKTTFHGRQDAIRYLALNASALLEDLWAEDDSLWLRAPTRQIEFEDMLAKRQTVLRRNETTRQVFEEKDFTCYAEDEIRAFAFDVRTLLLTGRARHLAICSRCQRRLEYWTGLVERFDEATASEDRRPDA